jgi:YVTN family beta-propeller protein
LAFSRKTDSLFVTNQYDSTVSVISGREYKVVKVIPVGQYPEGIATDALGEKVWVANWFDNSVSVIDADRLQVTKTISTGNGSRAFGQFMPQGPLVR